MFYKTTLLLLICCFATVLASTEFGCEFIGSGNKVPKPGEGTLWSEAVWGQRPTPLVVDYEYELKLFQAKIQEAREKVFNEHLFDQAGPYLAMIENMPDNKERIFNGQGSSKFEKWWANYQPMYYRRQDELGIMMVIMNQLSEDCKGTKWANVKNSFFFAAVRTGVEYKEIQKLDAEECLKAPKEKDVNELIGVIKVIVESIHGYILIDLDYYKEGALFIKNPWERKTQLATVKSPFSMEEKHVTISFLARDHAFIHLLISSNDSTSNPSSSGEPENPTNPTPAQNKPPPTSKVIFVQRPLCSILRTANVMMRYNPVITYGKLNSKGDMLAYALTRYPEAKDFDSPFCKNMSSQDTFCVGYLTTDESTDKKKLVERTLSSVQNMSPEDREFLVTVADKISLGDGYTILPAYEELMRKLTKLDSYMIEYKKKKGNNRKEPWNSVKQQAAKIKDKLPSWCGLGRN